MPIVECGCKAQLVLRTKKDGKGFFLSCRAYPTCNVAIWLPSAVKDAQATNDYCENVSILIYYFSAFVFHVLSH